MFSGRGVMQDTTHLMQPRHHLRRWGMEGTERDYYLFCGMVGPVRVK